MPPPLPSAPATAADLHAAGALYWGLAARREIGRVKHVPNANPNKAVALAAIAAHHALKALGVDPRRDDVGESHDGSAENGDLPRDVVRGL